MDTRQCKRCGKKFSVKFKCLPKKYCSKRCSSINQHIFKYDQNFLDSDTEFRSYFLGLFVTDGSMAKKKWSTSILTTDQQTVDNLIAGTNYKNKVCVRHSHNPNHKTAYSVCFGGKIPEKLIEFGFIPGVKTGKEHIPSCVSDSTFNHFLRGITDGDGFLTVDKRGSLHWGVVSACNEFIVALKNKINILVPGTSGGFHESKPFLGKNRNTRHRKISVWYLRFGHADSLKICEFIYKDAQFKLDRKYNKYLVAREKPAYAPLNKGNLCTSPGCAKPALCKLLCRYHYLCMKDYKNLPEYVEKSKAYQHQYYLNKKCNGVENVIDGRV